MVKILNYEPDSPKGAFWEAIESLMGILRDDSSNTKEIADGFVKALELLECVPIEKSVYAAAKAVLVTNFRASCRDLLDGSMAMNVRRGAAKDIDIQGRKVVRYAWL